MHISIFGLGYVGSISAACLSNEGHTVIGVDINEEKVSLINNGDSPIVEPYLDQYIATAVKSKKLLATTDVKMAVMNTDISIICVGTPNRKDGNLNLNFVFDVVKQIASILAQKQSFHLISIRSTVSPGTIKKIVELVEKTSGKHDQIDFDIASNPEFLREGSAIYDYYNPPYTLIGTNNKQSIALFQQMFQKVEARFIVTEPQVAEIMKFINNSFHALKVSFANEIGRLSKQLKLDGKEVMDIFMQDTKLNISTYYLNPGGAFGGSCLPKDTRALMALGYKEGLSMPLINNILDSNDKHIKYCIDSIAALQVNNIGFVGIAFKENTDDLRESPMVIIVEALIGKGYNIKIYDNNVNASKLLGSNKQYIENSIPHLSQLMVHSFAELSQHADLLVIGNNNEELNGLLKGLDKKKIIFDLSGINPTDLYCKYYGVCW